MTPPRDGHGDLTLTDAATPNIFPPSAHYELSPKQSAFLKAQTKIIDDEKLKSHILGVQERAFKIVAFPCIRYFTFLEHGMAVTSVYGNVLKLGRERPDGILLDVGSCLSVDSRKAVADGYPLKNIVTIDLYQAFSDLGHELFRTTPTSYPINFVAGNVFEPETLQIFPPFDGPPATQRPNLSALTSLNPLAGHCTAIYAGNLFHFFTEQNQLHLGRALAGLLSHLPDSVIFGIHVSGPQKGILHMEHAGKAANLFCHTPDSWAAMWDGEIFAKGKVRVDATLERRKAGVEVGYWQLRWSIVRL